MTTIDDFSDAADRELLECGNWIVGQYIIVSDSDKGSKLDRIKEERQIERAVTGLLGDGKLYPLFQPAIKLIESVFCMNEYKKRKPMVKDPAKALQLDGKGEITPENVHYYLRKIPKVLDKKAHSGEKKAFLRYLMFIGRNVAEAAREKGSRTKVSPAEMAALGEIARVFEIEPPSVDQMK